MVIYGIYIFLHVVSFVQYTLEKRCVLGKTSVFAIVQQLNRIDNLLTTRGKNAMADSTDYIGLSNWCVTIKELGI